MQGKFSWVLVLAMALMGCTSTRGPFTHQERQAMIEEANASIGSDLQMANHPWRSGTVWVELVIDRDNRLVDCTAQSASRHLADLVGQACWGVILAPIDSRHFAHAPELRFRFPLVIPPRLEQPNSRKLKLLREAGQVREQFMQRLGGPGSIPGIGLLVMNWTATSEGKIHSCQVKTLPLGIRKGEYVRDEAFLARAFEVCQRLDMAPFTEHGTTPVRVDLITTYAPWMK
ncbi:hypothetical protein [Pseudomonas sp. KNUC1026]|uniref:hypothetical protein n=1 Tax=Pseudomonas sp. KNUC1026 TaxID=2893890 RepID=UPI001F4234A1|nr:hypothetical protein [Pseudomonas sp. KNUC1026]UFH50771.1 hypothetical protein LN139_06500 [Pseudomonas sp. KNUC1026]